MAIKGAACVVQAIGICLKRSLNEQTQPESAKILNKEIAKISKRVPVLSSLALFKRSKAMAVWPYSRIEPCSL
jgi:hypothetical protein